MFLKSSGFGAGSETTETRIPCGLTILKGALHDISAHHVKNDVDRRYDFFETAPSVINDGIGPQTLHILRVISGGRRKDMQPGFACELDRIRPDTSASAVNQNALAGTRFCVIE